MIEEIKDIHELEEQDKFKNRLNEVIREINNLEKKLEDFKENFENRVNETVKKYLEELNKENEILKSQNEEVEKVKKEKININKFIEAFPEDIKTEVFSEEIENEDIINKLVEILKDIFNKKDNKIEEINKELQNKQGEIKNLNFNLERANKDLEKFKTKLTTENEKLVEEIKNKENEIKVLNEKYSEEKAKFENDIEKLNEEKKDKEKKLKKLIGKYEEIKEERDSMGDLLIARKLYSNYLEMDTRVKTKFEDILIQKDFESFVSSGYSISTIDNIWDIIKIEYKNISKEDLEELKEIFKFFIKQINKRFKEPKYSLIEVDLGEEFDAVTQVDLSQNSRGKIVEFVFYGYGFLKDKDNSNSEDIIDKIIKNPLVLTK
ncbi:hypothetical protein VKN79_08020 [Fusobacterium polymorphum]|jgi:DNA ligase 1|uniref:coiled-coil domain-containing protein n=1 Tax=Fusobacterium nucleatum subsp. polymorphum TaxID=76857 RepID=UPI002B4C229D|nr:hypothetical protein [Fusobacterium polymorphum]WRL76907.1 hypothetical protein VKN79_08020 [Fusobacterium polymorphum]